MPLIEIKNEDAPTARVKCPCGKVNELPLAELLLGVSADEPNQIALPPCACGSQEFLIRTFEDVPDVHAGHRKAVNAIAVYLKGAGLVHPAARDTIKAETRRPTPTRPLIGPV